MSDPDYEYFVIMPGGRKIPVDRDYMAVYDMPDPVSAPLYVQADALRIAEATHGVCVGPEWGGPWRVVWGHPSREGLTVKPKVAWDSEMGVAGLLSECLTIMEAVEPHLPWPLEGDPEHAVVHGAWDLAERALVLLVGYVQGLPTPPEPDTREYGGTLACGCWVRVPPGWTVGNCLPCVMHPGHPRRITACNVPKPEDSYVHDGALGSDGPVEPGAIECTLCGRRLETTTEFYDHVRDHYTTAVANGATEVSIPEPIPERCLAQVIPRHASVCDRILYDTGTCAEASALRSAMGLPVDAHLHYFECGLGHRVIRRVSPLGCPAVDAATTSQDGMSAERPTDVGPAS